MLKYRSAHTGQHEGRVYGYAMASLSLQIVTCHLGTVNHKDLSKYRSFSMTIIE